jgi:RNA polymerase sigma factor (sigma-70 family)
VPALLSDSERQRHVLGHLGLVHSAARHFRRASSLIPADELVSAGYRALVSASQRFDPTRHLAFSTYAYPRIRGEMQDLVEAELNRHKRTLLLSELDALAQQRHGDSDPEELTALWQLDSSSQVTLNCLSRPGTEDLIPSLRLPNAERVTLIAQVLAAVERLPETERTVLKAHLFDDRPLSEIGADLGVSKVTASRILARAIEAIREQLNDRLAEWPEETPKTKARFSPTFRADIVRRAQQAQQVGLSIARLARETKVPATNIREWLKRASSPANNTEDQRVAA